MAGFQDTRPAQYLKWLNAGAMLLHTTYFVLGLLLFLNGSMSIKLVQDVPTYYSNVSGTVNASQCDIVEKDFLVSYTSDCTVGDWDGLLGDSPCYVWQLQTLTRVQLLPFAKLSLHCFIYFIFWSWLRPTTQTPCLHGGDLRPTYFAG